MNNNLKNKIMKKLFLIGAIFLVSQSGLVIAQDCTDCNNSNVADGTYASKIGLDNLANGDYSFAGGENSLADSKRSFAFGHNVQALNRTSFSLGSSCIASGIVSFALGSNSEAQGDMSFAIGTNVRTRFSHSFALGSSPGELVNHQSETMIIGFNSINPTLFISRSPNDDWPYDKTGRIGIGNMTDPQAKLHIYADDNEDATLLLEPSGWAAGKVAKLMLGDSSYWLKTGNSGGFQFNSTDDFTMRVNYEAKMLINSNGIDVKGKTITETFRLFNPANPPQSGYVLQTDALGNGLWQEASFSKWDDLPGGAGIMYNNGHVGIGTTETYEYMLAVGGKIISEEVTHLCIDSHSPQLGRICNAFDRYK